MANIDDLSTPMAKRFRGYLPVVVDVETGGLNASTDALLEIAAILLRINDDGLLEIAETYHQHVLPFTGANLDPKSLAVTGIDPYHPFRYAISEKEALGKIFQPIRKAIKAHKCNRAVLVGHNASFDLNFIRAAVARCNIKRNPFHRFTCFDTATLSVLAFGQTVLARSLQAAGLEFDREQAHSALYDTERTAQLFCHIFNRWQHLGGWKDGQE